MDKTQNNNKKLQTVTGFCILLLLLLPLLHISVRTIPYVYNDEFGYWGTAAYLNGFDWSETMSEIAYYGSGYGIILAGLIRIFPNMESAYRAALMLNGLWLALSFLCLYRAGNRLYSQTDRSLLVCASMAAVLTAGNFAEVNYTWPECFLFFLFCLFFDLMTDLLLKYSLPKALLLGLLCGYSYSVHQRTLGIILAVAVAVTVMMLRKKLPFLHWAAFCLGAGCILVLVMTLKGNVISGLWSEGKNIFMNNMEGQVGKLASIGSLEGIRNIVLSAGGKCFYLFGAAFLLVPFAIWKLVRQSISSEDPGRRSVLFREDRIFLLLSVLFTIGINAVFMIVPGNITHIVYGRYTDNILGPFILIAILELLALDRRDLQAYCIISGLFGLFGVLAGISMNVFGVRYKAAVNSAALSWIVQKESLNLAGGIALTLLAGWLLLIPAWKLPGRKAGILTVCILLSVMGLKTGSAAYLSFEEDWEDAGTSSMACGHLIQEITDSDPEAQVYVLIDDREDNYPQRFPGNGIQFILGSRPVRRIFLDQLAQTEAKEGMILLIPADSDPAGFTDSLVELYGDGIYRLFAAPASAESFMN